jgi:HEAT repeat protein
MAQAALGTAAADPDPRVRDAALRTVASSRVVSAQGAAMNALGKDSWTFVRASAASALAALPASEPSNRALGHAVDDPASSVRAAAIVEFESPILARLVDRREDLEVRVAAAQALGALCDVRAIGTLADDAVLGASSPDPSEVALGLAATSALGEIHPEDLEKRLQRIRAKGNRPDAQRAAEAAIGGRGTCR